MDAPKLTKSQKYYQAHKEEIAEKNKVKTKCECGAFITQNNMAKHKKTQIHMLKAKIVKYEFIDEDAEAKEDTKVD
jgi:ribosomal protein S27AE